MESIQKYPKDYGSVNYQKSQHSHTKSVEDVPENQPLPPNSQEMSEEDIGETLAKLELKKY